MMLKVGVKYILSVPLFISLKLLMNGKSSGRLSAPVIKQNRALTIKQRGAIGDHFTGYSARRWSFRARQLKEAYLQPTALRHAARPWSQLRASERQLSACVFGNHVHGSECITLFDFDD